MIATQEKIKQSLLNQILAGPNLILLQCCDRCEKLGTRVTGFCVPTKHTKAVNLLLFIKSCGSGVQQGYWLRERNRCLFHITIKVCLYSMN